MPTVQPPAELFVPTQRESLDGEPDREPDPPGPTAGDTRIRVTRKQPIAIAAVLLSGLLGVVTIGTFPEPEGATTQNAPSVPEPEGATTQSAPSVPEPGGATTQSAPSVAPERPLDDTQSTAGAGTTVVVVPPGTPVTLPGPNSRDWVAPGARSDGALVRAALAEESIEFRAANTQPGRPGAFRMSWSGGTPPHESGDATSMLGIRPGGWVAFVIRPLSSPAELVVHLGGNDVAVTVDAGQGSTRSTVSAPAAIATVALPAGTAATVTVTAEGNQDVAVATAELQDISSPR
ncbi:hypothetical protein [Pseudonocardia cypriaca]|uniref:hypothetical protein n=1 Tax=Pseudonocardia cypriaca TaxID=882449 RepID=UPI00114EF5C4|nr:hypothetical protein [Pseudonocardia cypriaca]